jgi:hypothetical protein
MRGPDYHENFDRGVDLALPEPLAQRRARTDSTFQLILCLLLAQMAGIALYAGVLQFH